MVQHFMSLLGKPSCYALSAESACHITLVLSGQRHPILKREKKAHVSAQGKTNLNYNFERQHKAEKEQNSQQSPSREAFS